MSNPKTIYLKDYQPPSYEVEHLYLRFDLDAKLTTLHSEMQLKKRDSSASICLSGHQINLVEVKVDGKSLSKEDYTVSADTLTIHQAPDSLKLEIVTSFSPKENKALEGLYESSGILCTQNEPQGFRRMTYFFDRPDVMTRYKTYLEGDKKLYPYLLSNGNLIEQGDLGNGKHFCLWEDPFLKPTYLFALVAGNLGRIQDHYKTMSGRDVLLEVYCDPGMESQCLHAMEALKKSMKWDEEKFDREYDLDRYMIVAVDSFNMGAMENKGLNIFNSSCALVDGDSATDLNFKRVEEVISHEYFHNWTGNRITCRDWFQLTLKEGLTVFRDQEFTADEHDRPVERIEQAACIQGRQFLEDAGPMSHPIKPASYIEINNFYSSTVYRKGAEVIRMIHTLIGPENFKKGMDHYFATYDGQAVTTEDFLKSMEIGGGISLKQFERWYHQAGTPTLTCDLHYSEEKKEASLSIKQSLPETAYNGKRDALHMPVQVSLYSHSGKHLEKRLLELKEDVQVFTFSGIEEAPLASINENFTAPVRLDYHLSFEDRLALFSCLEDPFNKWQTLSEIYKSLFRKMLIPGAKRALPTDFVEALKRTLSSSQWTQAYLAHLISFPNLGDFIDEQESINIDASVELYDWFKQELSSQLYSTCHEMYEKCQRDKAYTFNSKDMGRRSLKNQCLAFLFHSGKKEGIDLCLKQLQSCDNMTDRLAALGLLVQREGTEAIHLLEDFYTTWKDQSLVVNKWLALHATSKRADTFNRVKEISVSPAFNHAIPNRIRALHGAFAANIRYFHQKDGSGYQWLISEAKKLDAINPQIASSLLGAFQRVKRLDSERQQHIVNGLNGFLGEGDVSKDSFEIASKTLQLVK